jgi:type IV pilus assembly protein PilV
MGALKLNAGVTASSQRGALMIEVLVTIVIMAIGLIGLMQMQNRLQKSEIEAYQRTQAVMLVNDMASRLSTNRAFIDDYLTSGLAPAYLGTGGNVDPCESTYADGPQPGDSGEWCRALQGGAETAGGADVGAMVSGRGCIESLGVSEYMVTVVWQGMTPISAPPAEVTCGAGLYDLPAGSDCADNADMCRRYVTTLVRIPDLSPP